MSLFSWNSFCQPPWTWCLTAIELRVSPLTTLYSPLPFLTFLPVGVVTVLWAAGREEDREACWVERVVLFVAIFVVFFELLATAPLYGVLVRPLPQTGQAPLP